MTGSLARTALYNSHIELGGKLVDFAGWAMPVQYGSIVDEHLATRNAVGLFDVSHMGRFSFSGPGAKNFLDSLLTRRVDNLAEGFVRYSLVTNDQGGILDDVLVSHLKAGEESFYWLVVNASNREKLLKWISPRIGKYDLRFSDDTLKTAMIAIQGPKSTSVMSKILGSDEAGQIGYYTTTNAILGDIPLTLSRTGYTGEDGFELILPASKGTEIWQQLVEYSREVGGQPAGLAARDTLRLEAGMPLYGHELNESISPFDVGLGFAVHLKNREFPGSEALRNNKESPSHQRIGLELEGRRVPREHYTISSNGNNIGEVSSGTFSPTLQKPIAMGIVQPNTVNLGDVVSIDIRGREEKANVVKLPFYKRD